MVSEVKLFQIDAPFEKYVTLTCHCKIVTVTVPLVLPIRIGYEYSMRMQFCPVKNCGLKCPSYCLNFCLIFEAFY